MPEVKLTYYTENDLQFLHELLSDSEVKKYFPLMYTTCIEQSELRLKARLIDQEYNYTNRFLIKETLNDISVGEISGRYARDIPSTMEVAVLIHPHHRGNGFAKAGTIEFMKYIKKHNKDISKFRLEIADNNYASLKLANELDFKLEENKNNMQNFEKDVKEI